MHEQLQMDVFFFQKSVDSTDSEYLQVSCFTIIKMNVLERWLLFLHIV